MAAAGAQLLGLEASILASPAFLSASEALYFQPGCLRTTSPCDASASAPVAAQSTA